MSNVDGPGTREVDGARRLTRAFVELVEVLTRDHDVGDLLQRLCDRTHDALGVDAVGVLLESETGVLELSTASTHDAGAIDAFEMQRQQGPCYEAYRSGAPVVERDLGAGGAARWPQFAAHAREVGFRVAYAFPLRVGKDRIGAMNLFLFESRRLDEDTCAAAQALADIAAIGILNQRAFAQSEQRAEQLQRALHSRVVIEQAKGTLAERLGITADEAFRDLRHRARTSGRKLHDVCREVVARPEHPSS